MSSASGQPADVAPQNGRSRPPRGRRPRNASLTVGIVVTAVMILIALVSIVWTPHDVGAAAVNPRQQHLPMGTDGYLIGTDHLGRDMLSQIMVGVRTSFLVSTLGVTMALIVGLSGGLVAATRRGMSDESIMRVVDLLMAFPGILFALVLAATIGIGMTATVVALMVFFAPDFARVSRSSALRVLQEDFVMAARIYGRRSFQIVFKHVIPNIMSVVIIQFTLLFAIGIIIEAALSFLGVGVVRPGLSLGMMLREAQTHSGGGFGLALWPGLTIVIAVVGLNLLGDGLRDILDPKLSQGGR